MKIHRLSPLALILASSVPFQPSKVYADCGGTWLPGLCEFGKKVMPQSVQDAGAEFDRGVIQPVADAIKEGADSAARLCRKVGVTTCMNPNFLNTYATVKLSANAGLIKDADSCGAMVQSAISGHLEKSKMLLDFVVS